MKKILFLLFTAITVGFAACSSKSATSDQVNIRENILKSGSSDSNYVELTKLNNNIWMHTTYANYNGNRTPSNGLVVVTSKGLVLIDTPWNNEQTKELIKFSKNIFKKDFTLAVITHAHEDRIGGIDTLLENKIVTESTTLTAKETEKNGFKKPQTKLDGDPKINIGNVNMEIFYPGEGHSVDNIVVWFPQYKLLFGGCFIKSLESKDIGNTNDANIQQWPISAKKALDKYPDAEIVVPGHGNPGNLDLVKHTLELLRK